MPKEVKRNFKTYSENDVYVWLQKLSELPKEIENLKVEKQNLSLQKEQTEAQLKSLLEQDLAPIQLTIKKINAQIDALQLPLKIGKLEASLPSLKETLDAKEEIYEKASNEKTDIDKKIAELDYFVAIKMTKEELRQCEVNITDLNIKKFQLEQEQRHIAEEVLKIEKKYSDVSSQIRLLEDQIRHASYTSSTAVGGNYYSSQTANDGGYSSSQTPSSGTINSSNQYTTSVTYQNLQRQLEMLQQQRRNLSEQRSGIYTLRDRIEKQFSAIEGSLRNEISNKKDHERELKKFTDEQIWHADASALETLRLKLLDATKVQDEVGQRYRLAKASFDSIKERYSHLKNQISDTKTRLNEALATRGEFASNESVEDLRDQLDKQMQLKAPLEQKETELEVQIRDLSNLMSSDQRKIDKLEDELQQEQQNTFLQDFTNHPGKLYEKLCEQITIKLDQFDREYPINQSSATRITAAEIRSKLELIAKQVPFPNSTYQNYLVHQVDYDKKKYIETCGLLQAQLEKLEADKDQALRETIDNILHENPLEKNYALTHYLALGFNRISEVEYEFLENQQYQQTMKHFKDSIKMLQDAVKNPEVVTSDADKNLLQISQELIKKIEEHEASPRKGEAFDYKYYNTLVVAAEKLAYDPKNLDNQRNFYGLIQHVDNGKPSIGQQILGVGMMLLGTAVCIGSAFVGFIYPKAVLACAGLGVSLIAGGIATFLSGRSHGLHQRFTVYGTATQSSTFFRSLPSAPPVEVPQQTPQQQQEQQSDVANSGLYPQVGQIYTDDDLLNNMPRSQFSP